MDLTIIIILSTVALLIPIILSILFRKVVSTNEVHIIQYNKTTKSFGKDTPNGNIYYEWPSWVPLFGVSKTTLPVSVFDLDLIDYEAYDKGRLPFYIDIKAFFRVTDSNVAAQRVESIEHLKSQLKAIVQGSVRTILAGSEIHEIMQGRSKFGIEFTKEVEEQLSHWGVATVKNIELMDIRDVHDGHVIKNIMEKQKSHIEMESRQEVAKNMRDANISEIEAKREVESQQQTAMQAVGLKKVENERQVGLATEQKMQAIKEQQKLTAQKTLEITQVELVQKAEIDRKVAILKAEQEKQQAILYAEGSLEKQKRDADGITLTGEAKANAEKAMQLAPVEAQIKLAKEIGENNSYQQYLVTLRKVEADQAIGVEQAKALMGADVKVIVNSGNAAEGLNSISEVFSSKGGTQLGAMVEGFVNTETGKKILNKIVPAETKPNGHDKRV